MTSKKKASLVVKKDPDNRRTVILDRWPTEAEKDAGARETISKARKGQ